MSEVNKVPGMLVEDCGSAGVVDTKTGENKIVAKDATGGVSESRGVATDPRERRPDHKK